MDCGCRDISRVIGPLLEGAEMSDDTAIADDKQRMLTSSLPAPFPRVYRCSKNTPKTAISATFQHVLGGLQTARLARQHVAAS